METFLSKILSIAVILSFAKLYPGVCGNVRVNLSYTVNDGIRPFFYGYRREGIEEGVLDAGGTRKLKEVTMHNGRFHDISLNTHSFELVKCETSLKTEEFYEENQQKVKEIYYKEMEECIKKKLGAERVHAFHHQVRNKERSNAGLNVINTTIQGYANGIHSDTHPKSAEDAFAYLSIGLDSHLLQGRFMYMNLWRSIDDDQPIMDQHLAVLDQTSLTRGVGSEDYIETDFHGEHEGYQYSILQYGLNEINSDHHRWFYFPNMTKSESIFFKQWDSDPQQPSNMCFHTAFKDPTAPSDPRSRQSIEVRVMAFFPDHRPNTCPSKLKIYPIHLLMAAMPFMQRHPYITKTIAFGFIGALVLSLWRCCRFCCSGRKTNKQTKED